MGSSVVSPEDVLESLMLDGTVDAIRLKIINQLKTNEELRNNTITMVEESRVLSTPGAEKQTKRELFEALRTELETQALEMASKAVWELILDNNGLGKDINETVEEVFCRLSGGKAPPLPMDLPHHQQPMPPPQPPLQTPPQPPQPPTLLHQFPQQQLPPLPQLLQQLLLLQQQQQRLLQQQQQHGALPPPFQPLAQLQHPPLAQLPQLPLQHFPQQQAPLPPQLHHPPLAPLPQLPLHRLPQPPPLLHQLSQQQHLLLPPQPPLPPQLPEQPPPPPPSPPPPQPPPPPPSPPSPMQQLLPSLQFLPADVQMENNKDSGEGEKVVGIEMTESSSPRRAFRELNMPGAAVVGNGNTEIPTVTSPETEMPSMDP